jgi:hypothetical protein
LPAGTKPLKGKCWRCNSKPAPAPVEVKIDPATIKVVGQKFLNGTIVTIEEGFDIDGLRHIRTVNKILRKQGHGARGDMDLTGGMREWNRDARNPEDPATHISDWIRRYEES